MLHFLFDKLSGSNIYVMKPCFLFVCFCFVVLYYRISSIRFRRNCCFFSGPHMFVHLQFLIIIGVQKLKGIRLVTYAVSHSLRHGSGTFNRLSVVYANWRQHSAHAKARFTPIGVNIQAATFSASTFEICISREESLTT